MLIDHGANVNARKKNLSTPLYLSATNGYLDITELLLGHGADVHAINDEGETPLDASLHTGYQKITDLLREHGAGKARFAEISFVVHLRCLTGISFQFLVTAQLRTKPRMYLFLVSRTGCHIGIVQGNLKPYLTEKFEIRRCDN